MTNCFWCILSQLGKQIESVSWGLNWLQRWQLAHHPTLFHSYPDDLKWLFIYFSGSIVFFFPLGSLTVISLASLSATVSLAVCIPLLHLILYIIASSMPIESTFLNNWPWQCINYGRNVLISVVKSNKHGNQGRKMVQVSFYICSQSREVPKAQNIP